MTWVGPKSNDKCLIRDREDAAAGPVTRWPPGAGRGRSGLSPGAWVWGGGCHTEVRRPASSFVVLCHGGSAGRPARELRGTAASRPAATSPLCFRAGLPPDCAERTTRPCARVPEETQPELSPVDLCSQSGFL